MDSLLRLAFVIDQELFPHHGLAIRLRTIIELESADEASQFIARLFEIVGQDRGI